MAVPRVLVVCEFPTTSGGERSLLALLPELAKSGFEMYAAAPREGKLAAALKSLGVMRHDFEVRDANGVRASHQAIGSRLLEIVRLTQPDLVHANSLAMGRVVGAVSGELGVPSVAHLRDIARLSRAAVAALNQHDRILAVSQATREYHTAQGVDRSITHVVYNGVDLDAYRPRAATGWLHEMVGVEPSASLVGCVGQLVMRKGQDVLAAAAGRVVAEFPATHFVIVGERYSLKAEAVQYEADLRAAFFAACGEERTHFLGWQEDIARCLREFTVLAHPARQEPLGRVLLESAACGLPVVASNVGGTGEIFSEDAAVMVEPGDAKVLSAGICSLLADNTLRSRISSEARRRAERLFSVRLAGERLAAHYHEVLAGRGPPCSAR